MARLTLTDVGRAALADPQNTGTRAVTVTRVAIGTGTTPANTDDSERAALRSQVDAAAAGGDPPTPAGVIDVRSTHEVAAVHPITEVGLLARIGAAGDEFLFAYWCGASASDAIATTTAGSRLTIYSYLRFAAELQSATVTLDARVDLHVGTSPATVAARGIVELATAAEARAGSDGERAVTPAALAAALAALRTRPPAGVVMAFAGDAIPDGYLELNGQAVSRTDYAALFALWGANYGAGDGSTTFNLPNLQRRTIVGAGGVAHSALGNVVGNVGGRESFNLVEGHLPPHSHSIRTDGTHRHAFNVHQSRIYSSDDDADRSVNVLGPDTLSTKYAGAHSHGGRTGSTGGDRRFFGGQRPLETYPPVMVMRWIVSAG